MIAFLMIDGEDEGMFVGGGDDNMRFRDGFCNGSRSPSFVAREESLRKNPFKSSFG